MVRRSQSCRGITVSLEPGFASVKLRRNSVGDSPVLVMHDGVTKPILARLIPANGFDFPRCEKVVKMIIKRFGHLWDTTEWCFRCDNEPSILALLRAVKLAWTGGLVQETSAEGDPQSNGAAESSVNVVKRACRNDPAGGGVSFGCGGANRP